MEVGKGPALRGMTVDGPKNSTEPLETIGDATTSAPSAHSRSGGGDEVDN